MSATLAADTPGYRGYAAYHRLALLLLTLNYACGHLDRNVVTILMVPIKAEFGVSDTALGLLTEMTFALFYGAMRIPLGYSANRANRRHLLDASSTMFSAHAALSVLASSFGRLFAARIGIGTGEGGVGPAAQPSWETCSGPSNVYSRSASIPWVRASARCSA